MAIWDPIFNRVGRQKQNHHDSEFSQFLEATINKGGLNAQHALVVKDIYDRFNTKDSSALWDNSLSTLYKGRATSNGERVAFAAGGFVGINDYSVKGRRQWAAERRRLLDLYSIVMGNGDVRTALTHLRNEIFRRGLEWEPAFEYKCSLCSVTYTAKEAKRLDYRCDGHREDESFGSYDLDRKGNQIQAGPPLHRPDISEIKRFEKFLDHANYFGQSLEAILREAEDDINIVDDAFIYLRKMYSLTEEQLNQSKVDPFSDEAAPTQEVVQIFRLDPTLVEFDMDDRGIPGQAHHACVLHRDEVLDVPFDAGWDMQWKGVCPKDGLRTYPIYFKYYEQSSGTTGNSRPQVLFLFEDEVIHWSRFSPSETYGYPPILSIYEKVLTLIGMDRYLYDYFYERKIPQGVVTVTTDDPSVFDSTKREVEAKMQADPHYIPWIAITSKTGHGKMEFVRFAYSLDELDYLPVRDEIRERIAGIYGVSQIWMQSTAGIGGLNSESQQLTVMSRVVEGAQRSYHTEVFPKLLRNLNIQDWNLIIKTPEETDALMDLQLMQTKASIAATMAGMGFGVDYDSDDNDFTYTGRVLSAIEQEDRQMKLAAKQMAGGGGGGSPMPPQQPMMPQQPATQGLQAPNSGGATAAKPIPPPTGN